MQARHEPALLRMVVLFLLSLTLYLPLHYLLSNTIKPRASDKTIHAGAIEPGIDPRISMLDHNTLDAYPLLNWDNNVLFFLKYGNASQYTVRRMMPSNSLTKLYRATDLSANSLVMLKQYPTFESYLRRELLTLLYLPPSDYIATAKDLLAPTNATPSHSLVTEYLQFGMNELLQRFIVSNSTVAFVQSFAAALTRQYLCGLSDLKQSNVLLNHYWRASLRANYTHPKVDSLRVKIVELGYANFGPIATGTPFLVSSDVISVAPEILLSSSMINHQLDMWDVALVLLDLAYYDQSLWKMELEKVVTLFAEATMLPIVFIRYYCYIAFIHGVDWLPTEAEWPQIAQLPHYGLFSQMEEYLRHFLESNNVFFPQMDRVKIEKVLGVQGLSLLTALTEKSPLRRISVEDALLHPFITSA